jgi:hypothetical protein
MPVPLGKANEAVKPIPKIIKSVPKTHFNFIKISPPIFKIINPLPIGIGTLDSYIILLTLLLSPDPACPALGCDRGW